jgi:hypothetical protein
MGRLEHLKKTLPKNMQDNADYPDCQFVVLNYGDEPETNQWIKDNFQQEIDSGRLKYISYSGPKTFLVSHAKNIAHLMADGDIVCNMDADQYTGKNFAQFLADAFDAAEQKKQPIFMRHDTMQMAKSENKDIYQSSGKIALRKSDFVRLRGYDETFQGWGGDDAELAIRLRVNGIRQESIPEIFAHGIPHTDDLRVAKLGEDDRHKSWEKLQRINAERVHPHALATIFINKIRRLTPHIVNACSGKPTNPDGFGTTDNLLINFSSNEQHQSIKQPIHKVTEGYGQAAEAVFTAKEKKRRADRAQIPDRENRL